MTKITYSIVEHDGGWAYKVDGTFSETFATRADAHAAAERAAREQLIPGQSTDIAWEDERGRWHTELARGDDRPETEVED
jgi:Uncharacterized protein conserved in bacteria (DUF2188)